MGDGPMGAQSLRKEKLYKVFVVLLGLGTFIGILALFNHFGIDPLR